MASDERPTPEDVMPAATSPCGECSWLKSNQDRATPPPYEEYFTRDHHVRCWRDARHGLTLCHLTAPVALFPAGQDPRWIDEAFAAVPATARPRECAGTVAAVLHEMKLLVAAGSFEAYQVQRPNGLTLQMATIWAERIKGGTPRGWPSLRALRIDEDEIVDVPGMPDINPLELEDEKVIDSLAELVGRMLDRLDAAH